MPNSRTHKTLVEEPPLEPPAVATPSPAEEPITSMDDPRLYVNRELSLLQFQRRVLEEAQDDSNPLLERVKFLSIVGSNLDEFFMVRVAGLMQQIESGITDLSPDGLPPVDQLKEVRKQALAIMTEARVCFRQQLMPALAQAGIHLVEYNTLTPAQKDRLKTYFEESVFPVLTPLALDPGRPFPHISNLSLNLAVLIRDQEGQYLFARLKVPNSLPAFVNVNPQNKQPGRKDVKPAKLQFVRLEQVIAANLQQLFPGMEIVEAHPFRITRNADLEIQELEAVDLLETIEEGVRQRRFGDVVRLTVHKAISRPVLDILMENLEIDPEDVYTMEMPLGLSSLMALYAVDRPDLKEHVFSPRIPAELEGREPGADIFSILRPAPLLLHHPFDSFLPVVEFLRAAARDPHVLAIKMTLYRVGKNSPVVEALIEANENGKQVAVLVELKARFDEESNIHWARRLEKIGVHVVYGLVGLKTHCKVALVVRREGERMRRYVHLSTGNYNALTSQVYTDIGMFTCDEEIGADATDLFNYLTGYSAKVDYRKLLVAPISLGPDIETLIEREIELHQKHGGGHMILKTNSLIYKPIVKLLYRASQSGVKVDLLVRGVCCLRPGVPGFSENITVTSVVGRFLEHSRIYYFRNQGEEEIYLGSADLMHRNLYRRVEVLFPVEDAKQIRHLRDEVLEAYLHDNVKARCMLSNGTYCRRKPASGEEPFNAQERLLRRKVKIAP